MAERKRIGVPISGLDTSTPDHSVVDGKCETLHNLRYTGSAWRNVKNMSQKSTKCGNIVYKHPASPSNHYIDVIEDTGTSTTDNYEYFALKGTDSEVNEITFFIKKEYSSFIKNSFGEILSKGNSTGLIDDFGFVLGVSNNDIIYEPFHLTSFKTDKAKLYWKNAFIYEDISPTSTILYFLSSAPELNDSVFIEDGTGAFIKYGQITYIDNNKYSIQTVDYKDIVVYCYGDWQLRRPNFMFTVDSITVNNISRTFSMPTIIPTVGSLVRQQYKQGFDIYTQYFEVKSVEVVNITDADEPYNKIKITCLGISDNSTINFSYNDNEYVTQSVSDIITSVIDYPEGNITQTENNERSIYKIREVDGDTGGVIQDIATTLSLPTISHFGNMLIINNEEEKKTLFYLYSNGIYSIYLNNNALSCRCNISIKDSIPSPDLEIIPIPFDARDADNDGYVRRFNAVYALSEKATAKGEYNLMLRNSYDGYIRGEFAYFIVVKKNDGTELIKTMPQIVRNEVLNSTNSNTFIYKPDLRESSFNYNYVVYSTEESEIYFRRIEFNDKYTYGALWKFLTDNDFKDIVEKAFNRLKSKNSANQLYKLRLNIEFDGLLDDKDIKGIDVYATRLYPLFYSDANGIVINPVKVLEEPFYLMAELSWEQRELEITSVLFDNIEQGVEYKATQTTDSIYAKKQFEYNSAVHMYDIQKFFPIEQVSLIESNRGVATECMLEQLADNTLYSTIIPTDTSFALKQSQQLVFPTRLQRVVFGVKNGNYVGSSAIFKPTYRSDMDISYLVNTNLNGITDSNILKGSDTLYKKKSVISDITKCLGIADKYKPIMLLNQDSPKNIYISGETYPVSQLNRIQVSENNNPAILPFDRSYRIGSSYNEIIAINSGAIEMSDSKFGEFPLYVFTKEGIFAMQSGKETLYSAIIPINYDVIINPNTLAVNGMVLYFTDKGLHALTNQGAQLLSEPINSSENSIPNWMRTSEMIYLPEWNEIMCTDLESHKAYIFSLDNRVWSTRDIPDGYILNNDELVSTSESKIYNLRDEVEQMPTNGQTAVKIVTRPIKLGSMELKRAETMIVRFECDTQQTLKVKVEGSINGETDNASWHTLRDIIAPTNKDIVIRRTPFSVKYLRFTIEGNVTDDIRILAFELEYYERMRHRMR